MEITNLINHILYVQFKNTLKKTHYIIITIIIFLRIYIISIIY